VELVGLLGFYTTVSMTLNTFRIEAPVARPPLDPDQRAVRGAPAQASSR
jgi:hypothetical protein